MKISQIMTKKVITVHPEMAIEKVAKLLVKHRIHGIPVINEEKEVVGIITEVDFFTKNKENIYLPQYISLLKKINPVEIDSRKQKEYLKKIKEAKIKDIMTANCVCLEEDSSISEALKIFKKNNFNMLPVVNDKKRLAGVVSLSDLIKLIKK